MLNRIRKFFSPSTRLRDPVRFEQVHADADTAVESGDYYRRQGSQYFDAGNLDAAASAYKKALACDPDDADAHANLGMTLKFQMKHRTAVEHLERAIALDARLSAPHYMLGTIAQESGDWMAAARLFRLALARKPDFEVVYRDLCYVLFRIGEVEEAGNIIEKGISLNPDFTDFHYYRGILCAYTSRFDAAIGCFRRVLLDHPGFAEAHFNLGEVYRQTAALDAALDCFAKACALNPAFADPHNSMGVVYREQAKPDSAVRCLRQALQLNPNFVEAHSNLGSVYLSQLELAGAIACFQRALSLKPDFPEAQFNLGVAFQSQHNLPAALTAFERALALRPDYADARWSIAAVKTHILAENEQGADAFNEQCRAEFSELATWCDLHQADGGQLIGFNPLFHLTVHASNCRQILSQYGALCVRLMQAWYAQQGFVAPIRTPGTKIRIGIVSADMHDHPVWHAIVKGWYRHLDQSLFEIQTFYLGVKPDRETDYARSHCVFFADLAGTDLRHCAQTILDRQPDILLYPSIGMHPTTLKLASMRLAPVQAATWGHPEGTGLPTIDYFVSAEDFEPENAQDNYAEQLVRLPHLGCTYAPLAVDEVEPDFSALGIDFSAPVLLCPGMPYKYAARNDRIFVELARKLGRCQLIFFTAHPAELSHNLKRRLQQAFAGAGLDFSRYCLFLPWQTRAAFFSLMKRAHLYLDTIGYSGFNTAMQALQCGLPVVTQEGKFMRGRFASGILKRAGLSELVVQTEQEYIDLVLKLGQDNEYRSKVRQRMQECSDALFDDTAPAHALTSLLLSWAVK